MSRATKSRAALAAAAAALATLWLVVMPWLAERTGARDHVQRMETRGLDPSALFYTDHDRQP